MEKTKKQFEDSRAQIISGCIKFSSEYVSYFDLFKACKKWTETDTNVLTLVIRNGGQNQVAIDFRYDVSKMSEAEKKGTAHTIFKPTLEKLLGEGTIVGWDYANDAYIVK